jgi:hypothetical protein
MTISNLSSATAWFWRKREHAPGLLLSVEYSWCCQSTPLTWE